MISEVCDLCEDSQAFIGGVCSGCGAVLCENCMAYREAISLEPLQVEILCEECNEDRLADELHASDRAGGGE